MSVLSPDIAVTVVDHAAADLLVPGRFAELVKAERPGAVLHLAWTASGTPGYRNHPDNERWRQVSVEAARACDSVGSRFIGVGTVVDDVPGDDAYSRAKFQLRAELAEAIGAKRVTWLRPFYVFDPDRPSPAVVRAAMEARDRGVAVDLATPDARHDFVHAADVGAAIITLLTGTPGGVIDIGSGKLHTVAELVEACGAAWTRGAGTPPSEASSNAVADRAVLHAAGWSPVHTERFFGDD